MPEHRDFSVEGKESHAPAERSTLSLENTIMIDDEYEIIFRMTITRNGRRVRRRDGKPWMIRIRRK